MSLATVRVVAAVCLCAAGPVEAIGSVSFADDRARERYGAYVAWLERDPERFAGELATVRQLERSEVEYRFVTGGAFEWNVEGSVTTDGERVFVNIADRGSMSRNSRIAHELEHARQFDDGEIAFERNPATGRWSTNLASYDIGDEVKACHAQLRASLDSDLMRRREGSLFLEPTVLGVFARAETDAERARVLASRGYGWVSRAMCANVTFGRDKGYAARQLVRPDGARRFFGRVQRVF